MSVLSKKLRESIAKDLGVSPDDVTPEFIRQQRERLSPRLRLVFDSKYGGHNTAGLRVLSNEKIKSNREKAKAILAEFATK
jgi:hypothetical protein